MKRALLISPHFPPDSSAATHRVRLLAPHLSGYGWAPTVLTLQPEAYETKLDLEVEKMLPDGLQVARSPAWPVRWTRPFGIGDLGLRALRPLHKMARQLLVAGSFDLVFITIYPSYPALLGPRLKREFSIPFVLDYQDPWVGAWGATVGGGAGGKVDLKSRLTRRLAESFEPKVLRSVDAITAVSQGTYLPIIERHPEFKDLPFAEIPLGSESLDFEYLRRHPRPNRAFEAGDGLCHVCFVGTVPPMGSDTLEAFLRAVVRLREITPQLCARLRLHFVGTSAQSVTGVRERVKPLAVELGLGDIVTEIPERLGYLEALAIQIEASALLLLGSSEPHYTASRIFPALLARRPILALFHEESTVVSMLRKALRPPTGQIVSYDAKAGPAARIVEIAAALREILEGRGYRPEDANEAVLEGFSSRAMAGRLAAIFDRCVERS